MDLTLSPLFGLPCLSSAGLPAWHWAADSAGGWRDRVCNRCFAAAIVGVALWILGKTLS